ncbi:MAG: hypothetical protein JWN70_2412 [Planctomycetaceae bacterium]|nr:hypothetical protein [Planctomycetaceae bacterium]
MGYERNTNSLSVPGTALAITSYIKRNDELRPKQALTQPGNWQVEADDSNCFTKGSSAGGVAGDDCESDPGERLHFRPTTLFSFFDVKLSMIVIDSGLCEQ